MNRAEAADLRIVCRRSGNEGLGLPAAVVAAPPLSAQFPGEDDEVKGQDGLIQASRNLRITVPPSDQPGLPRRDRTLLAGRST